MPNFIAVPFTFDSVLQTGRTTVSAKFSYQPNAGTAGYSFLGPQGQVATVVTVVPGVDYGEVVITVAAALDGGTWTLSVDTQVTTDITLVPVVPASHTFFVVAGPAPFLPFQGTNQDAAKFLRSVIPSSMKGPAWDALITAMATGSEQPAWDNAPNVFDALFLTSALDYYLNRRASELGLERPRDVPLSDESWRSLVITLTADKLTTNAIMDVLTIFYGVESTHAHIVSGAEPFGLFDSETLELTFDGLDTSTVTFKTADFSFIAQATAEEVVGVLNRTFLAQGLKHFARVERDVNGNNTAAIYTGTPGLVGAVLSASGAAQATLALPTTRSTLLGLPRASYVRSLGPQSIEVVFPATISIAARARGLAAYLQNGSWEAGNSPYLSEGIGKGLAVTETADTLGTEVLAGHQYALLNVTSSASFPDSSGYLVLGYGWDYQTGPVPYLGVSGSTYLVLDPTYTFPFTVPAGADVRLLNGKSAPTPSKGQFWLTATPDGRLAAMGFVDFITAAGYDLKKTVLYPGDMGLGNEGYPTSGSAKLSDIVRVFGGDDLDTEIPALRQES
jgi:hypothetical protein